MQNESNEKVLSPKEEMKRAMNNISFGKTVAEALDNLPKTKTAILIDIKDLYSSPKKWNFYDHLDDNKKLELMESIQENGILSPIIVWDVDFDYVESEYGEDEIDIYDLNGSKYLILAGHNRVDAFNKLYLSTEDEKYLKIPAFIFKKNDLDLQSAKEIVIDTNYVQRVLNTKETHLSIMHKYAEIERDKNKKGRTREIVAEQLGISPSKVEQYKKLDKLIQSMKEMVYDDKIALNSMLKIVDKSDEVQQWIYDTYGDLLTNKMLNKVKPYMKKADIEKLFEKELQPKIKTKKVSVEVPEDLIEEFKTMFSKWVYEKTKRD